MFESEIKIEVERRLQKACDERALVGLPPPVSIDALRAIVRTDLLREVEARRATSKVTTAGPARARDGADASELGSIAPQDAPIATAVPTPRPPGSARIISATQKLIELSEKIDPRESVFPSLRNANLRPVADQEELAALAIIQARRVVRGW